MAIRLVFVTVLLALIGLLASCGGDDDSDATSNLPPAFVTTANEAAEKYGIAVTCLFPDDFTSGGWQADVVWNDVLDSVGLKDQFERPATGTVGSVGDGRTYISIYDAAYEGVAFPVKAAEFGDKVCFVPVLEGAPD
ncbi:MAG: hypothetical protein IIA90_00620 [Chloroflexi bacterium]|nr:hypothetical protein [Chloroflexota bacterium]